MDARAHDVEGIIGLGGELIRGQAEFFRIGRDKGTILRTGVIKKPGAAADGAFRGLAGDFQQASGELKPLPPMKWIVGDAELPRLEDDVGRLLHEGRADNGIGIQGS